MRLPSNILKRIHFVGIGGIGMSGIAEILHTLGYTVQGSDLLTNSNTERLQSMGISVFHSHIPENIDDAEVIVISSAVKDDNPEYIAARKRGIPVIKRAEMLAEIMRFHFSVAIAGTHGKTTTTSMCAAVLDAGGFDPTVINGGIINSYKTNARLGKGEWIVVETDESDGSFVKLPATIGVITNIDPEHLEHYGSFDELKKYFYQFIENLPFYGLGVLCIDHPEVRQLYKTITDRRLVTYGLSEDAQIRAHNIIYQEKGITFDVTISRGHSYPNASPACAILPKRYKNLFLPMVGEHNLLNFLATIAVSVELNISEAQIRTALSTFQGVKRRFTQVGFVNGVNIIDDYAHHPTEIKMVLKAAKQSTKGRVIAVMQPHRYTRLRDLFEEFSQCFSDADQIIITPVYAAGESPIDGVSSNSLVERIKSYQHNVRTIDMPEDIPTMVSQIMQPGDTVIYMGAGNITQWAAELPTVLEKLLHHGQEPISINTKIM